MYPTPREFSSAAELRAHARAVRRYFKTLPPFVRPEPPAMRPIELVPEPLPLSLSDPPSDPPPPIILPSGHAWKTPSRFKIRDLVIDHFGITLTELLGSNRSRIYSVPRQFAYYLLVHYARMSTVATGRFIGGKDHSTVCHALKQVRETMQTDPTFAALMAEFVRQIEEWQAPAPEMGKT